MIRRISASLIAGMLVAAAFSATMPPAGAGANPHPVYLSLGDSVAAGFQPGPHAPRTGYVDDLWRIVHDHMPDLGRHKLGCPGETASSLLTGDRSPCEYDNGSQLDAAVAFLERHGGHVPFVTLTIGGNDLIDRCFDFHTLILDRQCVTTLVPHLSHRLTRIADDLQAAAPDVPIVGMTYYDPFLGVWALVPGGRKLARIDERAFEVFNAGLTDAYENAGVIVADVAATFRIDDFGDTRMIDGKRVPINVARACGWTWFCSGKATGDVHPNSTGYRKIARTFSREILPRLP